MEKGDNIYDVLLHFSNIAGGTSEQRERVMENEKLMAKIMELASTTSALSSDQEIASEANWVLVNCMLDAVTPLQCKMLRCIMCGIDVPNASQEAFMGVVKATATAITNFTTAMFELDIVFGAVWTLSKSEDKLVIGDDDDCVLFRTLFESLKPVERFKEKLRGGRDVFPDFIKSMEPWPWGHQFHEFGNFRATIMSLFPQGVDFS